MILKRLEDLCEREQESAVLLPLLHVRITKLRIVFEHRIKCECVLSSYLKCRVLKRFAFLPINAPVKGSSNGLMFSHRTAFEALSAHSYQFVRWLTRKDN